jgi:hypothetical protein
MAIRICFAILHHHTANHVCAFAYGYHGIVTRVIGLDGASRSIVQIIIPPRTVEWHYSFTTRKDAAGEQQLQLAAQLSSLLLKFTPGGQVFSGLPQVAIQTLNVTSGSSPVNVYVLDANNANAFIVKQPFSYLNEGFATDATQGVLNLGNWQAGTYYIGIENRSSLKAVLVDLEAAAIKLEDRAQTPTTVIGN